ncbi:MAG: CPXCG motif-containing cysteine-rich protein [Gammaproteobacteria bacterium]|jgi:transcription elongation factor Elf1|nr:CPXCG motif-containing cysteine-rich protein [Gammaproteobacteria bacterium]
MTSLNEQIISCPYCGEQLDVLIDVEEAGQQYIEDCQVCCCPIVFVISAELDGELSVSVHAENESF